MAEHEKINTVPSISRRIHIRCHGMDIICQDSKTCANLKFNKRKKIRDRKQKYEPQSKVWWKLCELKESMKKIYKSRPFIDKIVTALPPFLLDKIEKNNHAWHAGDSGVAKGIKGYSQELLKNETGDFQRNDKEVTFARGKGIKILRGYERIYVIDDIDAVEDAKDMKA
ncbi:hypothetical protein HAX54_029517 [Datura stramonium]|uniref:Uncharacterized protein n=1 Tax=Datura stramonium TaxID=4076 RepID=A0ABS8V9E7_DATST|nr:hypothetical protein [Datura stramonium]